MRRSTLLILLTGIVLHQGANGEVVPPPIRQDAATQFRRSPTFSKALGDTDVVLFSRFESGGETSWEGWTSFDLTEQDSIHWRIDDYLANGLDPSVPDNHAWACNTFAYPACSAGDEPGGYGNGWYQILEFTTRFAVPQGKSLNSVQIEGVGRTCSNDSGDTVYLSSSVDEIGIDDPPRPIESPAGGTHDIPIDEWFFFEIPPLKAAQLDSATLRVRFMFKSDWSGSDQDCEAPADCAVLLDNLTVRVNGAVVPDGHVEDCEDGTPVLWTPRLPQPYGDFAALHTALGDDDRCVDNSTTQVTFVDDGTVVPGTGGTVCQEWCYGPGGYVLNTWGGLAGSGGVLRNEIRSPVFAWPGPSGRNAGLLEFDLYHHSWPAPDSPGVFVYCRVASAQTLKSSGDLPLCSNTPIRSIVFYGDAGYDRIRLDISDLIEPGAQWAQVVLGVWEYGALWPGTGDNATPAPYFDNVCVSAFTAPGPFLWAHPAELAQDGFPAGGTLDHAVPANNNVRFDMARATGGSLVPGAAPGDSIVCTVAPLGEGNVLQGPPVLYYLVKPNSLFDSARTAPTSGWTPGTPIFNQAGEPIANRWAFDLPDEGLLFPGDVLHYYIRGEQTGGVWATLPADTTGYAEFGIGSPFDHLFVVRALPSITGWVNQYYYGWIPVQPGRLWWNDAGDTGTRDEWVLALQNLGMVEGVDIDIYETNAPDAGVGNGLGGRATPAQILMYNKIAYSSGDLETFTLGTGEERGDPGDDVGLLLNHPGAYSLLLTGAHWASDLDRTPAGQAFLDWAGVSVVGRDTREEVGGLNAFDVYTPASVSLDGLGYWSLRGGCPGSEYDAIVPTGDGARLAEYLDGSGNPGAFSLAAWVIGGSSYVWSLPYDLAAIMPARDPAQRTPGPIPARARFLKGFFGPGSGDPSSAPPAAVMQVYPAAPNPFNPRTVIALDLSAPSTVRADIYDMRGRWQCTLADSPHEAGRVTMEWDGMDDAGHEVAAGVYFCRIRALNRTEILKLALIR